MLADNDCVESFYECSFLLSESRIVGHHDSFCQFMCASAIIAARSIIWDNMATRSNQVSMQNTIQPSTSQLSKYFCQQFLTICILSTMVLRICWYSYSVKNMIPNIFVFIFLWKRTFSYSVPKKIFALSWVTMLINLSHAHDHCKEISRALMWHFTS